MDDAAPARLPRRRLELSRSRIDPLERRHRALAATSSDVKEAIRIILETAPGERVMRPRFGCGIHDLVFEEINATTLTAIEATVRDALVTYEPRIELLDVAVDPLDALNGCFWSTIDYRIRRTNQIDNLVYPFYFREGGDPVIAGLDRAPRNRAGRRDVPPGGNRAWHRRDDRRTGTARERDCRRRGEDREEVTRRLDRVPDKQADNFYTAVGIGRDPARPAPVPVAFKLAETASPGLFAPAGHQADREHRRRPTIFETESGLDLAPGSIAQFVAVDLENDKIFVSPPGCRARSFPLRRRSSGRSSEVPRQGKPVVQITPPTGLARGMAISIPTAEGAAEYGISAVEGDLFTIEPPLAATFPKGTPVREVTDFAPFAPGGQDRQSHTLYLSHSTMLEVPAALSFIVAGAEDAAAAEWSWWGKTSEEGPPDWQALEPKPVAGRLRLKKAKGKPEKRDVGGRNGLWLRARLPGASTRSGEAQDIRLAVSGDDVCNAEHDQRCGSEPMAVVYEGIAVTTPIGTNKPYHPFGREPRIFDSFYIGCAEAFGKAGAEVSLCFTLGGAAARPARGGRRRPGTPALRRRLRRPAVPGRFHRRAAAAQAGAAPARAKLRVSFLPRAPVAARVAGGNVRVAVADKGGVYLASFRYRAPLVEGSVVWERLPGEPENQDVAISALFIGDDAKASVYALAENRLLVWTREANGIALNVQKQVVDLSRFKDGASMRR